MKAVKQAELYEKLNDEHERSTNIVIDRCGGLTNLFTKDDTTRSKAKSAKVINLDNEAMANIDAFLDNVICVNAKTIIFTGKQLKEESVQFFTHLLAIKIGEKLNKMRHLHINFLINNCNGIFENGITKSRVKALYENGKNRGLTVLAA